MCESKICCPKTTWAIILMSPCNLLEVVPVFTKGGCLYPSNCCVSQLVPTTLNDHTLRLVNSPITRSGVDHVDMTEISLDNSSMLQDVRELHFYLCI